MMEKNTYKGASQFLFFSYCFSAMDVTAIPTRHAECTVLIIHNTCFFEDEGGRRRLRAVQMSIFFFLSTCISERQTTLSCSVIFYIRLKARRTSTSNE